MEQNAVNFSGYEDEEQAAFDLGAQKGVYGRGGSRRGRRALRVYRPPNLPRAGPHNPPRATAKLLSPNRTWEAAGGLDGSTGVKHDAS
jgi:hypothetical protein